MQAEDDKSILTRMCDLSDRLHSQINQNDAEVCGEVWYGQGYQLSNAAAMSRVVRTVNFPEYMVPMI